jgi:hypothetical protein
MKAWRWSALALVLAASATLAGVVVEAYSEVRTPEGAVPRVARSGLTAADTLDYATTTGVAGCAADPTLVVVPTWSVAAATAQVHVALYDRTSGGWAWSGIAVIQTMTAVAGGLGTGSVLDTDGTTLLAGRYPAAGPPMLVDTYGRAGFRVLVGGVSSGNLAYQAHSLGAASQAATQ